MLQYFRQLLTAADLILRSFVEVGSELSECFHFSELRKVETQLTGNHLHGFGLSGATYPADRDTGVDSRTDTGVEQVCFQEDLTVGDRDNVCWDVCRNVARLGFDDGQRCGDPPPNLADNLDARSSKRLCK